MGFNIHTPFSKIKLVDKKRLKALKRLGLERISDLLFYFPSRYEDLSKITKISSAKIGEEITILARFSSVETHFSPLQRLPITEGLISDNSGSMRAIWFNQPYLKNYFRLGEAYIFHGRVEYGPGANVQLTSPIFEKYKKFSIHTGRIVPIYPETHGITSKWLRFMLWKCLKMAHECRDFLPTEIKKRYGLIDLPQALWQIHFPASFNHQKAAKLRLSFDELFLLQLRGLMSKKSWQKNKNFRVKFNQKLTKDFVDSLPFKLTNTQKIAAWEILRDLEKNQPMNRLLEGDVGSGKTVVASIACLNTIKNGFQTAFMAPTEILAFQHFETFQKLYKNQGIKVGLFTAEVIKINDKVVKKAEIIKKITLGLLDIVIGTHTLIEKNVKFKKLALVIIDEQHRFGVEQRATLKKMNSRTQTVPHLLSMTATPIPRSLALACYGDLDLSIISEMPKGRKKIITKIVTLNERKNTYQFIANSLKKGEQTFVVCPRIKENGKLDIKAAEAEYKNLRDKIFPEFKVALLHGKLKKDEKEKIMASFSARKIDVLVSTSVVEVGVDIPEATIMLVESAERFGLAQLHQLRGRVGRRQQQAYCFLFTESNSAKIKERLEALLSAENGFALAEKDLELRGPGELYGTEQSGEFELKIASLADYELIKTVRAESEKLITDDPELKKYPLLREKLGEFEKVTHLE